jgi:large subunit ribosomal protein L30
MAANTPPDNPRLRITQVRSLIGAKPKARASVRSLGLKRIHQSVVVEDTPQARGYLHAASHLLAAEPVENEAEVTNRDN